MRRRFTPEFKKKIARLYEEGNYSQRTLAAEYGLAKSYISKWYRKYGSGCKIIPGTGEKHDSMDKILCLKKENEELRNEAAFLKKVVAYFAKEIA